MSYLIGSLAKFSNLPQRDAWRSKPLQRLIKNDRFGYNAALFCDLKRVSRNWKKYGND